MNIPFRTGLAAVAALGLSAASHAQPVPAAPPPAPPVVAPAEPQVVKWPGGYVVVNGSEVIVRQASPGRSTNVISGAGNGVGNKIVVDGGGLTIVSGSRVGVGNRLIVDPDDLLIDLDWAFRPKPVPVAPMAAPKPAPPEPVAAPEPLPVAPPLYKGKANAFWAKKAFSEALDCNVYWCPTAKLWYRFHADDDIYRPLATQPPAPTEEK